MSALPSQKQTATSTIILIKFFSPSLSFSSSARLLFSVCLLELRLNVSEAVHGVSWDDVLLRVHCGHCKRGGEGWRKDT